RSRGSSAPRLPAVANAGAAAAGAGRRAGNLLLLGTPHCGYAPRPAGSAGSRGTPRRAAPRTPHAGGRSPGLRDVSGNQLSEVLHLPGALRPRTLGEAGVGMPHHLLL